MTDIRDLEAVLAALDAAEEQPGQVPGEPGEQQRVVTTSLGEASTETDGEPTSPPPCHTDRLAARKLARSYFSMAEAAAKERETEEGWHFVFRAQESLVLTWDDCRVSDEARGLEIEATESSKFNAWRKRAIQVHVASVLAAPDTGPGRNEELAIAMRIRNEQYENEYRRLAILRRHQWSLLWIGGVSLTCVLVLLLLNAVPVSMRSDERWLILAAPLIAVVGAVVSAAQRSGKMPQDRIPMQLSSAVASMSRIPIGAVAGLTTWLAAQGSNSATNAGAPYLLLTAFAAGFSERLVSGTGTGAPAREVAGSADVAA